MAQYRREREWFVVGESAALIMMSALQFICYCHDRLAGGVWCFDALGKKCEVVGWSL